MADVYVRIGDGPETEVQRVTGAARSISSHQVAVSGDRLLWNEVDTTLCGSDCAPRILKTCVLPCATVHTLDALTPPSEQGSVLHDIDLSGTQATWAKTAQLPMDSEGHVFTADVASCDVPPCESPTQVDAAVAPQPVTPTSARVDGTRFAWSQQADGQDIFWRDFAAGIGPLRANSLSLGPFVGYTRPSADGDFVAYSNTGAVPGASETSVPGGIWATELEPRRHFVVAPLTTAFSAPAITGTRVAWSDSRKCQDASACDQPSMDVYERDPLDVGAEVQLSSPDFTAGSPDSDGSTTVWHCRSPTAADPPTRMCVHDGNSLQTIDLSPFLLDPSSVVGDRVRISAGVVGWYEFFEGGGPDARLHVLDTGTMSDQVVGQGVDVVGEFPDFDLSGSDIVWAGPDDPDRSKLWRNTVTGNAGTAVEFEVPVNRHVVNSVAVDGSRVVWIDCPSMLEEGCDVYTRDLGEFDSHLVSDGSRNGVLHPTVDDETDRVYWTYADQEDTQGLFMESLTGAPLPPGDTTAPSAPTNFTAGANTGTVGLSWVNPTDADFFRIRILRTGGKKPPKSLDDPKATVVHEGNGTSFTDTDVVTGVKYSYAIYAFDLSGNLSPLVTTSTG